MNSKISKLNQVAVPIKAIQMPWERTLAQLAAKKGGATVTASELDKFISKQKPEFLSPGAFAAAREDVLKLAALQQEGRSLPTYDAPGPSAKRIAQATSGRFDDARVAIEKLPEPYWQKSLMQMADTAGNRDGMISAREFDAFLKSPGFPPELRSPDTVRDLRTLILLAALDAEG